MAQSAAKIILHIIFSTKNRRPWLTAQIQPEVSAYLAGTLKKLKCSPIHVNCVEDHVHILCYLSRNVTVADLIEEIKKGSSK